MQKVKPSQKEKPAQKKKNVTPLTLGQQNLVVDNYKEAMNIAKQEANKLLAGRTDYYVTGIDITGVAEEILVLAATKWKPEHKANNFLGYYRVCVANGLKYEYHKNERYARANYDPWNLREVHQRKLHYIMCENVEDGILQAENRIAYKQFCEAIDEKLSLKAGAEKTLGTMSHELSLKQTAESAGLPTHTIRYDQKKVVSAIRTSKEMSQSMYMMLTEKEFTETADNAGPIEKKF